MLNSNKTRLNNFDDLNRSYETDYGEKYSFISLYLFILIFFIILSHLVKYGTNQDLNHLLNIIPTESKKDIEAVEALSQEEAAAVYYSDKISKKLPAEVAVAKEKLNEKIFELDAIFDDYNLTTLFKEEVMKQNQTIERSQKSYLLVTINISNSKDLLEKLSIIVYYLAGFKNPNIKLEITSSIHNSRNYLTLSNNIN